MAHTPGPWTVNGPAQYASTPGCMVYAYEGNGHLVAECNPAYAPNQQDNARLIAAAPQMLSALREINDERDRIEQLISEHPDGTVEHRLAEVLLDVLDGLKGVI